MKFIEPIQLPDSVNIDEATKTSTYGKFEIGPLEPGYATTIGNTLRRVLLSSIQGAAVQFVKIEGLHHEFASIPGSDSDFVDVILRLKKLIIVCDNLNEVKVVLHHKGKGIVTAEAIEETSEVKIINKDLVLLEMTEDVEFFMELWIANGRGYVSADKQNVDDKPVGVIPIDSIYTPITKVNFEIENQRVGEKIDYDKLVIEISTDGSIIPKEALYLAAKILRDLYDSLVLFDREPQYVKEIEMDPELGRMEKLLNTGVNELELSVRCSNCLTAAKIESIGELVSKSENEMLKYRNFGKKSLEEINDLLVKYDLALGMNVADIRKKIDEAKSKVLVNK
jgi:DNA-directed RNA polymerase subunit alpha